MSGRIAVLVAALLVLGFGVAATAASDTSTTAAPPLYAGHYYLSLEGTLTPIDFVADPGEDCARQATPVTNPTTGVTIAGAPKQSPCLIQSGETAPKQLWQWISSAFAGGTPTKESFSILRLDGTGHEIGTIDCGLSGVSDVVVPGFTVDSMSRFLLSAVLRPDHCTTTNGTGAVVVDSPAAPAPYVGSGANVTVSGSSITASAVDAFELGDHVNGSGPTTKYVIDFPSLGLHVKAANTGAVLDLKTWYQAVLVNGIKDERTITVSLHNHRLLLAFGNCGIYRLDPEEEAADGAYAADAFTNSLSITGADVTG